MADFYFSLSLWERPTIVEIENRLGLREKRQRDARTHHEHLMFVCASLKIFDVYKHSTYASNADISI